MEITISPEVTLFHQRLDVYIRGLQSGQKVSVGLRIERDNKIFLSHAHFVASQKGDINVWKQKSHGGSYTGILDMGLFWLLKAQAGQREGLRFMPKEVIQPCIYDLVVADEFCDPWSNQNVRVLITKQFKRHFFDRDRVARVPVREGSLRGALYYPKHIPPRVQLPGIIDLYGTAGGIIENRAAIMASHGYVVLCLPYFGYEGLPDVNDVDMLYFVEAVDYLSDLPFVISNRIGAVGISYGAMISMYLCTLTDKVSAVVSINGDCCWEALIVMNYKGKPVCDLWDTLKNLGLFQFLTFKATLKPLDNIVHPLEKTNSKILIVASQDDRSVDAVKASVTLTERLEAYDKEHLLETLILPEAGHLIEPPYMPVCTLSYNRVFDGLLDWGGEDIPHAHAQDRAWKRIFKFLAQNTGQPMNMDYPAIVNSML